jgi:hypothetical protein
MIIRIPSKKPITVFPSAGVFISIPGNEAVDIFEPVSSGYTGTAMQYENGDVMLFENGTVMIYE